MGYTPCRAVVAAALSVSALAFGSLRLENSQPGSRGPVSL
jgi:hypothetical protein